MAPKRLSSSNIHHSTNITNTWQGQKSFFSGKCPYTRCTDDWHLMKHKCLVIEHEQWEACLSLSVKQKIFECLQSCHQEICYNACPSPDPLARAWLLAQWWICEWRQISPSNLQFISVVRHLPSMWAGTLCSHGNCTRNEQTLCLLLAEFDSLLSTEFLQMLRVWDFSQ